MPYTFPSGWKDLDAVLVHDWLTGMRGGERCLELLCEGIPNAPVCTLVHQPENISPIINQHPVVTSSLQRIPGLRHKFRAMLPFFPRIIESMTAPPAEVMISTSHCVAKGLIPPAGAKHLCYCFTPMRYGIFYHEYFGPNLAKQAVIKPVLGRLRSWDRRVSDRVDRFVAISKHVQRRILHFYGRESDVVYPPVDTDRCTPGHGGDGAYDLVVSALVPYKRIDLAVAAYTRLNRPLKVVGTGSEFNRLRAAAGPSIEFAGWQTDEAILELYRGCRFLIFPGEEDFGIVPVEAQACGKPVIAYGRGGILETVVPGISGVFFDRQISQDLAAAVEEAEGIRWNPEEIRRNAERFSIQNYLDGLDDSLRTLLG